jgi:hypothetical protein
MTFRYNVGLQNVGSYQVSGRPWCKHFTTTANEYGYVSFPNVTKNLFAHFDANSGGHEIQFAFTDILRRGLDMSVGSNDHFSTPTLSSLSELSLSFWIKPSVSNPTRLVEFSGGLPNTRLQGSTGGALRFLINNNPQLSTTGVIAKDTWLNIVVVINDTSNKVYVNGTKAIDHSTAAGSFTGFNFGAISTNYDDIYDDAFLIDKELNLEEILEIYNEGVYVEPSDLSFEDNIISFWDFEDNEYKQYYQTPDTATIIYDRVSSNNLAFVGTGTPTFVNGRHIDRAFENHKITLTGDEKIEMPFKVAGLIWYSSNSDEFSLFASLTNIPASRMHELTGPGIDE